VDPFEAVWPQVQQWLNERPDANAKELFLRLQESMAGAFAPGQLRTLQRRVKQWRSEIARQLVFGLEPEAPMDGMSAVSAVAAANANGVQA
jgi:predicted Abi (CAAX) family protease